jgi:hypothetical protein
MFKSIQSLHEHLVLHGVHHEWLLRRLEQKNGWNCVEVTFIFADSGYRASHGKTSHPTIQVPLLLTRNVGWEELRTFLGAQLECVSQALGE